ncbi:MAG: trp operon repressor [Gammaproteobacteria bacterium CG_4_10_14_0_8_um_filter_38_16]|nr:MAG: trp operon repressor [Gammaproteobacteria bacterium CG_4_10_14_0_8_um_filter_38_16]PJA04416.1 MAG: trp operon repressor [Gammaproteobacteria bacterium CG_4_10_14_0_2_um_filter_38_22]PJB10162.1 MAG: trp operon repressor [Gammaproteobacteria bacterium CG_4_9_14_3_um_filter_38_9]
MKNPWKSFLHLCLEAKNTDVLAKTLDCFLTVEEKESIADRYLIIQALLQHKLTQREMAEQLNVSIAKITRGSNALKMLDPKLKAFLEKNT